MFPKILEHVQDDPKANSGNPGFFSYFFNTGLLDHRKSLELLSGDVSTAIGSHFRLEDSRYLNTVLGLPQRNTFLQTTVLVLSGECRNQSALSGTCL